MNYSQEFHKQKFLYLPDFLDKTNCSELSDEFEKLRTEGKTEVDTQCPKSHSVYGEPMFDSMMEQLCPYVEQATGLKLYPTYSYARIYNPGEKLRIHRDRDSCEISVTLTLRLDKDNPWPILFGFEGSEEDHEYFDEDEKNVAKYLKNITKIKMGVGDAIVYKGKEIFHWREEFQGKSQIQVFLHYVDANGPHAKMKYDGRPKLSHHDDSDQVYFWFYKNALEITDCEKIIKSIESNVEFEKAGVGNKNGESVVDSSIRNVNHYHMTAYRGIGATLSGMGLDGNNNAWKFDITHSDQCDYLKYDKNGHYKEHIDTFFNPSDKECRKLTVLAFLNDDFEGGKFFIKIGHEKIYPPQEPGTVLVFPSFFLHGVEPVLSGVRRTIVTWLIGPQFK